MKPTNILFFLFIFLIPSCDSEKNHVQNSESKSQNQQSKTTEIQKNPHNNLYWGDTHLHTSYSPDAFAPGNRLDPATAYQFARGEEVISSKGRKAKLKRPLDFLVIADHAEGFGLINELQNRNAILMKNPMLKRWADLIEEGGIAGVRAGREMIQAMADGNLPKDLRNPKVMGKIIMKNWNEYLAVAERYNNPGVFTTLLGYEWTSMPSGSGLHRVVVFRDGQEKVGTMPPFSALQSPNPEDLWEILNSYETKTSGKVLAIPHNPNLSAGKMFTFSNFYDNPMTAEYAQMRANWEPLVEVTQYKGDSESHPYLSPTDEFAGYGDAGWDLGNQTSTALKKEDEFQYEYARQALKNGLVLESELGTNPYKFGMLGATDSHTGLSMTEEDNWFGKMTPMEDDSLRITKVKPSQGKAFDRFNWQYLSSGYAAVWAESNTRENLWDALKRKEVYATTGSRIQLRFFGGWDYSEGDVEAADYVERGYQNGVPMGGDLMNAPNGKTPTFIISATKDPMGANLDRIQIIKGWLENGETKEQIYEVAWAGNRELNENGKLPSIQNTVNSETATYEKSVGESELATVWSDPDFDTSQRAFYYVRVLEIPTPRWSTYDAVRYGLELPKDVPLSIQERAYSSPIWYTPRE